MRFHLHELPRINKSLETDVEGWVSGTGGGAVGILCSKGQRFPLGGWTVLEELGSGDGCTTANELNATGFIISNMVQMTNFTLRIFYCKKQTHRKHLQSIEFQYHLDVSFFMSDIELPVVTESMEIDLGGNYVEYTFHLMSSLFFISVERCLPHFKIED